MVNKEDIVDSVAKKLGYNKVFTRSVIEAFVGELASNVSNGKKVKISGLGVFEQKVRGKRVGRNPHTGEAVPIPERIIPWFTPSTGFKKSVEDNTNIGNV